MDKPIALSAPLYKDLIEYLATQPYGEVYILIAKMEAERKAQQVTPPKRNAHRSK